MVIYTYNHRLKKWDKSERVNTLESVERIRHKRKMKRKTEAKL